MKGMIVKSKIAGEYDTLKVAIPNGIVDTHVTMDRYNGVSWGVGGLKMPEEMHVSWQGGHLQSGDEIQIEFADVEQPAPLVFQESHSALKERMAMVPNDKDEEIWQRKLERYNRLKAILEAEGLIERG